jgi:hypothetical protein
MPTITITIDADALVHAAWMARCERGWRTSGRGVSLFTSIPDAALTEIIAAAGRMADALRAELRAELAEAERRARDRAIDSRIAQARGRERPLGSMCAPPLPRKD